MKMTFVDADGHILEPSDLWVKNLEPKYRDRAIRLEKDEEGLEYWTFGDVVEEFFTKGTSANVATIGKSPKWREEHVFKKHDFTWDDGVRMNPPAWDPHQRIKLMDKEKIDRSIFYPTLALSLPRVRDPKLAAAYCRVYNDWIIDFCRPYPNRMFPAIMLPWYGVKEVVQELKRTSKVGPRSIEAPSGPANDISYGDPQWDPIWGELLEQDLPISLHVGTAGTSTTGILYPKLKLPGWWGFSSATDMQLAFLSFFQGNVFDRFPELKIVILESDCAWMPWYLERLDDKYGILGFTTTMKHKPSYYFQRQCWISMDPDDELGRFAISHLGADRLIWAYDYPHSDSPVDPVLSLRKLLKGLPREDQKKVAGGNAIDLYHLPVAA